MQLEEKMLRGMLEKVEQDGYLEVPFWYGSKEKYHAQFLVKEGYVEGETESKNTILDGLTLEGYELLDSLRMGTVDFGADKEESGKAGSIGKVVMSAIILLAAFLTILHLLGLLDAFKAALGIAT